MFFPCELQNALLLLIHRFLPTRARDDVLPGEELVITLTAGQVHTLFCFPFEEVNKIARIFGIKNLLIIIESSCGFDLDSLFCTSVTPLMGSHILE
jgi:hypothetical protein